MVSKELIERLLDLSRRIRAVRESGADWRHFGAQDALDVAHAAAAVERQQWTPVWIPVSTLPNADDEVCAVIVNGVVSRCAGYSPALPEMRDGDEIIPAQPAEWWLDSEGITVETDSVTHYLALPPLPESE